MIKQFGPTVRYHGMLGDDRLVRFRSRIDCLIQQLIDFIVPLPSGFNGSG
jgi:hypothetical protein